MFWTLLIGIISQKPRLHVCAGVATLYRVPPSAAGMCHDMTARCVCGHVFFNIAAHGGEAQMGLPS